MLVSPGQHGRTGDPVEGHAANGPPHGLGVTQRSVGAVVHPAGERETLEHAKEYGERDSVERGDRVGEDEIGVDEKVGESHGDVDGNKASKHACRGLVVNARLVEECLDALANLLVETGVWGVGGVFVGGHGADEVLLKNGAGLVGEGMVGDKEVCGVASDAQEQHLPAARVLVDKLGDVVDLALHGNPRRCGGVVLRDFLPGVGRRGVFILDARYALAPGRRARHGAVHCACNGHGRGGPHGQDGPGRDAQGGHGRDYDADRD
mmetsp:Transcript_34600/g.84745  ORF Transcript_34600/g.84745 Transcript_34600/m.84745 type:complete len:264 (-) Transcript_34600:630-1421(-)